MSDVKYQLDTYFKEMVERLEIDQVLERTELRLGVHPAKPSKDRIGWVYALAVAAVVLGFGALGLWLGSDGEGRGGDFGGTTTLVGPETTPPLDGGATSAPVALNVDGVQLTYTVPASGWETYGRLHISKSTHGPQDAEALIFWSAFPEGAYGGACRNLPWPSDPTMASVASAVAEAPGVTLTSGPTDTLLGGRKAVHVEVIVREELGCDPGYFYSWVPKRVGALWVSAGIGVRINVWLVEVDGVLLFIAGETDTDTGSLTVDEVKQIVESISFDG